MGKAQTTIQFTKQPYIEDVGPRRIESIQFSTFSGTEVLKAAEIEVYKGVYYDSSKKPVDNGLLDPHMGPPNKNSSCKTCSGKFRECPGHCGYLALALPVYNVGYLSTIVDILKCICKKCSRILLVEKERQEFLRKMRNPKLDPLRKNEILKKAVKRCNAMAVSRRAECSRCGHINGMVKKAPLRIQHDCAKIVGDYLDECQSALSEVKDFKGNINLSSTLDPKVVYNLLENMVDQDCELLYLNDRPEKLMVTYILVPPNAVRPSVFVDGGMQSNENDITERLKHIIQANAVLRQDLLESNLHSKSPTSWEILQMEVAQYINSDIPGIPLNMTSTKPLSGFVQRLKGKQGRFRGNLSGKRVEYTGRTVISPDPNLKINEVAIPILMARILTYPERVSRHNIEKLQQCVRNGPNKYPGARFIRHPDGTEISLLFTSRKRHADELKYGYIVDRHLEDGDIVLFNRQPSLHRMSIMCHRARIMPWRTLRFNESVCNPYNADFDGDEMNMHVPQTEEARTEALMLMGVQHNLCTPKNGEILVASTQDFLTSSFLITRKDTFYDRASFSLLCSYMCDAMDQIDLPTPALIKPVELWTGKQLFSVLLRPHSNMRVYVNLTVIEKNYDSEKKRETMCPKDGFVYIWNSELISGQLGKATLGNGNKDGLYSVILRDYRAHAAAACMNRVAKLSARWIGNHGFSIGINDVQPGGVLNQLKKKKIEEGYNNCNQFIDAYKCGTLELLAGCDEAETLEVKITGELNEIRTKNGKVCMSNLNWRNSPLIMSQCGSKGSPINICQMIACVGQQTVGGRRAPNGFVDRTLPHFERGAKGPDAKGFVQNSFFSGLSATEFFFHTMGGREGLVDTAVKTADTGYMSRRLMKALEDLSVQYDNTVRNASGCIVQFMYGGDGMDPAQMEAKDGSPLNFRRLFMKVKATCPSSDQESLTNEEIEKILENITKKWLLNSNMTLEGAYPSATTYQDESLMRFAVSSAKFLGKPFAVLLAKFLGMDLDENQPSKKDCSDTGGGAPNVVEITRPQLQVFLDTCFSRYLSKKIECGTAIGAIGAQSIGEPGTQMTLKTFHFAGVASMNVTLGVPRIKEIINAAKRIATPVIEAKLASGYDNPIRARMLKGRIEKTVLQQVAKSIKTSQASRQASIVITLDMKMIQKAQLSIDAYTVKESVLRTPRIKLKEQQVKVLNPRKLEVVLQADKSKLQFELHGFKKKLSQVVVKGLNSVERAVIHEHEEKLRLIVEGTGFLSVMGIEGIGWRNTESNHIIEVQQTLGIEAARKKIIKEIQYTMKEHGMTIDIRHMMLLADLMTFKGEVLGITRHGLQKMKDSVLMLASFEQTADHLFHASVNGRLDRIEGVSECIIMGIPMPLGTGMLKVRQSCVNDGGFSPTKLIVDFHSSLIYANINEKLSSPVYSTLKI